MFFIHIVSFAHLLLIFSCAMSKSILTYSKPLGKEQKVKLPDPTGPLTEELPLSVISMANKDHRIFKEREFNKNERTIC